VAPARGRPAHRRTVGAAGSGPGPSAARERRRPAGPPRNELRGRLNAYRAKAAARGLAEHPELTTRYARARDLLFTAPCDLRASTRSVHGYQQTLAAILSSESSFDSAKDSTGANDSTNDDEGRPA